jgi:hypothetical protein
MVRHAPAPPKRIPDDLRQDIERFFKGTGLEAFIHKHLEKDSYPNIRHKLDQFVDLYKEVEPGHPAHDRLEEARGLSGRLVEALGKWETALKETPGNGRVGRH